MIINHGYEARKVYTYAFGQTRNIQMHLHSGSALIIFSQSSVHQPEVLRTCRDIFCSDAIKKAMLVHLMIYAKPLSIRTLQLSVNGQIADVYVAQEEPLPLVYSMINRELDHPLPARWKSDEIIHTVLNSAKSTYDGRHNALIALLIAKSKIYRSEKAMYLWMAMNGLYQCQYCPSDLYFNTAYGMDTDAETTALLSMVWVLS